jgi:hypothetical protein
VDAYEEARKQKRKQNNTQSKQIINSTQASNHGNKKELCAELIMQYLETTGEPCNTCKRVLMRSMGFVARAASDPARGAQAQSRDELSWRFLTALRAESKIRK